MDITTQMMTYVCAVATYLNFHKAAEFCHTSQPNLSTQIKKVENILNIQLFERSNKFVKVTENGEKVIQTFRGVLHQLDQLKKLAENSGNMYLKIGLFPTLAPYILPKLMPIVKAKCPQLELSITEDKTDRICRQLDEGRLDGVLAAFPVGGYNFEYSTLFEDEFMIAVSKGNPLASKKHVALDELKHEKVLLLEEGHCLRDQSLEICRNDLLPIDFSYQSTSLETLKAMVAGDSGITFVPKLCTDSNPLIQYIPLKDKQYGRTIALFWRKSSSQNAAIKQLKEALTSVEFF